MRLSYDFYKSLVLINRNLTKDIFLELSGVRDGYSMNMFSRMYESLTSELIDVDKEYSKYYSFEYKSIEHYLWKKFNFEESDIELLIEERKNNPDCILYRKDELSYGDDGLIQFAFSDTMYERINNLLLLKTFVP